MGIKESMILALKQLVGNKGRTILTMLGMFIGVGSVIMILSLGNGFKEYTKKFYADIGLGSFDVAYTGSDEESKVDLDDLEALKEIPGIDALSGGIGSDGTLTVKDKEYPFYTYACSKDYMEKFENIKLRAGRILSERDVEVSAKVVVISDIIAKGALKEDNYEKLIGQNITLEMNGKPDSFEIIGVYKTDYIKGRTAKELESQTDRKNIYMPYTTAQIIKETGDKLDYIDGVVKDDYDVTEVTSQVRQLINRKHHTANSYKVSASIDYIEQANNMLNILTLFISAVAGISLLVGGVGIMNIMLVTVKERTREIGIRKALGAKNGVILKQFLIEALMLTLIAGFIGMIVGYVGAIMVGVKFDIQAKCTLGMIVFAVGTSTGIGLLFGVYPAYQAAQMDPIEALRSE